jgi:hypothetical protein
MLQMEEPNEKTLVGDAATNRRNDRWIDCDPQNCPEGIEYIKTTK